VGDFQLRARRGETDTQSAAALQQQQQQRSARRTDGHGLYLPSSCACLNPPPTKSKTQDRQQPITTSFVWAGMQQAKQNESFFPAISAACSAHLLFLLLLLAAVAVGDRPRTLLLHGDESVHPIEPTPLRGCVCPECSRQRRLSLTPVFQPSPSQPNTTTPKTDSLAFISLLTGRLLHWPIVCCKQRLTTAKNSQERMCVCEDMRY
jgi:hypothetical protein